MSQKMRIFFSIVLVVAELSIFALAMTGINWVLENNRSFFYYAFAVLVISALSLGLVIFSASFLPRFLKS